MNVMEVIGRSRPLFNADVLSREQELQQKIIDASYGVNIIEKSNSGIVVEHEDSEKLTEGILTMSRMNDQDLEQMAINGYNYATEFFLYEKTVVNMIKILDGEVEKL